MHMFQIKIGIVIKSKKCIFIGYNIESNAYKIYDLVNKKIVISRDVVFDEKPAHVQTFVWKGQVLHIDKDLA